MKTIEIDSPIEHLNASSKKTKTTEKLNSAGILTIRDLLWIFPLHVYKVPKVSSFHDLEEGKLFRGNGTVTNIRTRPSFVKGRGRVRLMNISAYVKDEFSDRTLILQWFNTYPSMKSKIEKLEKVHFLGKVDTYQDYFQITTPELFETDEEPTKDFIVQYPTINSVGPAHLKKLIDKIPSNLLKDIGDPLGQEKLNQYNFIPLGHAFMVAHAKGIIAAEYSKDLILKSENRLIYHEFYLEQLKLIVRKQELKVRPAAQLKINSEKLEELKKLFPYKLTHDQNLAIDDVSNDLTSGHPMARMIQGDVGCGKTTVAIICSLIANLNEKQSALMCPTESLATQHFETISKIYGQTGFNVGLLLGSFTTKEKKEIYSKLENKEINLIIGTHSLFQEKVKFQDLGLAIIDEQHKFGVKQRLRLTEKGDSTHTLIMTATPIPRSLSLTHYGDLDFSIIKSLPGNRKGTRTRIVSPENFENFLSFVKTRVSMKEQVYIVTPAIEENPEMDFHALDEVYQRFKDIFPELNISKLHGKMSSEEKSQSLLDFSEKKTQILIATSVIEVGIDIPNATVMAIVNPERFGLSSLHQLRGRVGRGTKPGFCFLIIDKRAQEHLPRLQVIESTTDGFEISEADLKIRGEGELFGKQQSGGVRRKIANILEHQDILFDVKEDMAELVNKPESKIIFEKMKKNMQIVSTI